MKVKNVDGESMTKTYAILDDYSQGPFILDSLVRELVVHIMNTALNIKALDGKKTESMMIVKSIQVTGMSDGDSLLTLSKLFIRKNTPVNTEEITIPAKIKEWKHLKSISNELVQKDNVQIGLI